MKLTSIELKDLISLVERDGEAKRYLAVTLKKLKDELIAVEAEEKNIDLHGSCNFAINYDHKTSVAAVKLYRSITGSGLRDAHDFITKQNGRAVIHSNKEAHQRACYYVREYPGVTIELL